MKRYEAFRALTVEAMNAGCDEAERLGYGSELGYAEAASISEAAIRVVLSHHQGAVEAIQAAGREHKAAKFAGEGAQAADWKLWAAIDAIAGGAVAR